MDAELVALATSTATTVVGLMATDGWEQTKRAVAALWRRSRPEEAETVEAELGEARAQLLTARQAGDEGAEVDLTAEWRSRLRRLLAADPALERDLRELLEELRPLTPEADPAGRVEMHGTASDNARLYMSGGDMHITGQ
ncbi:MULTISPECIES: hypothetical protein [unclassified Kitasatospora]|uniref:hypothetical protein n=1 Tax=unclassified Kitasatospora TaxID=2633591 RepID=UPI000708C90E|nr:MULTISPECIES: hypothetical protein [unclassified Kitasatospora]KQV17538.1 hypothetical protein ASC99_25560 [Kitasatospora sp. Root107]KRB69215.1 hypothetical protein ASE03_27615 [Kitasatospora sp. Root187]